MSQISHTMRWIAAIALMVLAVPQQANAQLTPKDSLFFKAYEDTLNVYSDSLFYSDNEKVRRISSNKIIVAMKTALQRPNSYLYPFSRLKAISIVEPEDKAFRIFTWQLGYDNNTFRYFGAIQMNQPELKLYPLVDYSVLMDHVDRLVTDNERWLGALYYGIKKVSKGKNTYYTLFGFDNNNMVSTKKLADVLWFTDEGQVRFGAPIFEIPGEEIPRFRYVMEFRKEVSASLHYSPEFKKIVFDNLIPMDEQSEGMYFNYVPDGSYSAFEWKKGKWQFVEKLFDFQLKDGEFPDGH